MARIVFTEEEEAAIRQVMERFDPERSPLYQRVREHLSPEDWAFVVARERAALEALLRGLVCQATFGAPDDLFDREGPEEDLDREHGIVASLPHEVAPEISGDIPESILVIAWWRTAQGAEQMLREKLGDLIPGAT
ncbi:MAG TPA: hypothetical protein VNP94_10715 [Actinomycetota bacterium]|nr:hypothetical protein [Actinomycetota bacterium]